MTTKEKILQLATELIQIHGYSGWSYQHIAKEAGIKKASIHYYFPKKTDLLLAAVKDYLTSLKKSLASISSSKMSARKKLIALSNIYREVFKQKDRLCLCLILSQNIVTLPSETNQELKDHYDRLRTFIQETIQEGISKGEFCLESTSVKGAAELFISALQGLLVLGSYGTTESHFDSSIAHFILSLKGGK
ncbi:MAG: TetR/AcrR family transcriptional regulator [Waddliaceae bacterium]